MSVKSFWIALLLFYPFHRVIPSSFEGLRLDVQDLTHQMQCQKSEVELLHEKIQTLQSSLDTFCQEAVQSGKSGFEASKEKIANLEKRLSSLEKTHSSFLADLKTLKEHLNTAEEKLASLDKQLGQDVKNLKGSLQGMLALLQGKSGKKEIYTVQPGDSLGKIAQDQQVSLKELKECNQLANDQIYVGQKLHIPK